MDLRERMRAGRVFLDGAMGTMLMDAGLRPGQSPEEWNVLRPDDVLAVHKAYAEAGADVLISNTFGGNPERLKRSKFSVEELVSAGVRLARQAADESGRDCCVALDVGPLGQLLEPFGDMTEEEAEALFAVGIEAGLAAGPDCILIETMGDLSEVCAAVRAAKKRTSLPVYATMSFDGHKRLMTGADIPTAVRALSELGVDGVGSNCGLGPDQMLHLLPDFCNATSLPILMSPNAGLPRVENGHAVYDLSPDAFATSMKKLAEGGAQALGGCCGTMPAHIRAMIGACRA